jgi:hypothetical protein
MAAPVLAQSAFDDATTTRLNALGFYPSDWAVTPEQALEIETIVRSSENDQAKEQQIRLIMGDALNMPATETPNERAAAALEESVTTQLISLGFQPSDWVITESQALELQNVVSSTDSDQAKQGRVRQIMGMN